VYIAVYTEYKILKRIYEVVVVQQCVPLSALTHEPAQGIPQSIIIPVHRVAQIKSRLLWEVHTVLSEIGFPTIAVGIQFAPQSGQGLKGYTKPIEHSAKLSASQDFYPTLAPALPSTEPTTSN
jgi:hypothetical protein